ncbi:MAG: hypothetical protein E7K04_05135 [Helicobacter sp.]|nr:hypothetical protein [Helicobacter sp.]
MIYNLSFFGIVYGVFLAGLLPLGLGIWIITLLKPKPYISPLNPLDPENSADSLKK